MKLNKIELLALTKRVAQDVTAAAEEAQGSLNSIQDMVNQKIAKSIHDELTAFNKMIENARNKWSIATKKYVDSVTATSYIVAFKQCSTVPAIETLTLALRKKQTLVKLTEVSSYSPADSDLYNELVLAQIGCDDLDAMIQKVIKNYVP